MGKEEDERSPKPSTSMSSIQHPSMPPLGPTLPYLSPSNPEELRGSQETSEHPLIPPLRPTLPYPSSGKNLELRRFQETSQHPLMPPLGSTLPYHSLSNLEELRRSKETTQRVSDLSNMPNSVESEKNVGGTSHTIDQSYHISSEDKETTSDVNKEAEGTNDVSDDDERVEMPKSGMEFATEKELLTYYKRYAKQVGFGVRTQRTK
ncbi:uncharacterized protein LOC122292351 isoform X2 [Carya illinoinensis]|uniref:uncharacterized protein LOC122292351 isoform X2 n=1 Tax=Carya illinoinensis TaxID=32201 RepID=UPI001C719BF9|nr:uncharacterized protein LOC122292351 isoform X2 [Carya illinoinensis]XP_042956592.1 uncharacterized protein LOC122292351 isoform X2 [Carya illinoinensis]